MLIAWSKIYILRKVLIDIYVFMKVEYIVSFDTIYEW